MSDSSETTSTQETTPDMSTLEAFDQSSARKSRRNSMLILRAASQLNLAVTDDGESTVGPQSQELLAVPVECKEKHELLALPVEIKEKHGHGHHAKKTTDKEAMVMSVSALYGKLLVIVGMGFPIAKTLSHDLPLIYYNSFYLYLYFGSILFVIYAYISLLSSFTAQVNNLLLYLIEFKVYMKPFTSSCKKYFSTMKEKLCTEKVANAYPDESNRSYKSEFSNSTESLEVTEMEEGGIGVKKSKFEYTEDAGHGSMYLKMGTIIFGIGSMIYSGLEFGNYFELRADCSDILMAITPAARMVFTFLQMYFIFLNSRVSISRHTTIARFGIMHMVATNLCIWLNVLVEETKHTIHHVAHESNHGGDHSGHHESPGHHSDSHQMDSRHITTYQPEVADTVFSSVLGYQDDDDFGLLGSTTTDFPDFYTTSMDNPHFSVKLSEGMFSKPYEFHNLVKRASDEMEGCRIFNLMGNMVSTAAPLLFPCTIEYSLLCASVLYVMWKNVQVVDGKHAPNDDQNHLSQFIARKVRHLYSVDCGRASRGLFSGIFVLVLTLISLILFYVLISTPDFKYYGILSANISEILIYSVGIVTTIIGMKQLRNLGFIQEEETELDNILLVVAQGGVYMFAIFTLIGGYFSKESMSALTLITASLTLVQATLQTLYILDGSRRCCKTNEQMERKFGREMVTFLLMLNLSMWLFSTFQTSRAYLHKAQQEFYGVWAWTIISHISMPLGIFYRFHATVCLGEIWKRAYKIKGNE